MKATAEATPATTAARRMTTLTDRTPVDIDTALAALDTERFRLAGRYRAAQRSSWPETRSTVPALVKAIDANMAQFARLDAEYERRPWTRFVVVEHIHSGIWCVGGSVRSTSQRHWLPQFSGRTESEAITELAGGAHILCSFCFPNAPVVTAPADPTACSNKDHDPNRAKRVGYVTGNFGTCTACGARATLTSAGNLRKHKRPA